MLETLYDETEARMKKSVEAMSREFSAVRTGKATVSLLDTVRVDAYGSQVPLNQVGTIASPEPRLLVVQAFDKTTVPGIIKGIQKADLGLNPQADGQIIRIPVPPLNEQRRKELVRHCKNVAEDGRVAVRNIRRDANEQVKKAQTDKDISKDQEKDGLAKVQKLTDEAVKDIDGLLARKEKEVMEI